MESTTTTRWWSLIVLRDSHPHGHSHHPQSMLQQKPYRNKILGVNSMIAASNGLVTRCWVQKAFCNTNCEAKDEFPALAANISPGPTKRSSHFSAAKPKKKAASKTKAAQPHTVRPVGAQQTAPSAPPQPADPEVDLLQELANGSVAEASSHPHRVVEDLVKDRS